MVSGIGTARDARLELNFKESDAYRLLDLIDTRDALTPASADISLNAKKASACLKPSQRAMVLELKNGIYYYNVMTWHTLST